MTTRLAERLNAARHRQFVGRDDERALFKSAIAAPELPFNVLYVFGPGGVGKTTLLKEFAYICEQSHIPSAYVDARNVEPTPDAFIAALQQAPTDFGFSILDFGLKPPTNPKSKIQNPKSERHVIFIDTFELLAPCDAWLREVFLPGLPDNALIVLAGRQPPSAAWRSDPGWQTVIRTIPLRNLSPKESLLYLSKRSLPAEQHRDILGFTYGHPLALSLVVDVYAQRGDVPTRPEDAPDVVRVLLEQLVQKVPGPAQRSALEACALVRLTTEELLAEVLRIPDAHDLFEWLRGLSIIESSRSGIFPHDLARDALVADLRWRNPAWYRDLHHRARNYYANRLQQTTGEEQQRVLFDYIFLHRDNSMVRPFLEWQEAGMMPDVVRPGDVPLLVEMVERHEGPESARLAEGWFALQPEGLLVFRDPERQPAGFLFMLALRADDGRWTMDDGGKDSARLTPIVHRPLSIVAETMQSDPATRTAWAFLEKHVPLRPGEVATHFRFWMARDTYQDVSATQSLILVNIVRHYLTTRGLVYTFFPAADPEFWAPLCAYSEIERIPEADYEVGGRRYGVYGHNWRDMPPVAWLSLLADREIAAQPEPTPPSRHAAHVVVLSQPAFAAAVRDALRDFTRPNLLRDNPLAQSRLVVEAAGTGADAQARIAALQSSIKRAAEQLQESSKDAKLYRVLYHTYLHPAPTQEQAAELLDLPFSTYRRHLKTSVERVTEILWQWELHGS